MAEQPQLVAEILKRLHSVGILDRVLIIGSWCGSFYRDYFKSPEYAPVLRTRDIDFLVPQRTRFAKTVDLEELLADLGFEVIFSMSGKMKLESPELIIELLVPETGPAKEKPYPLPQLKFNAQPLRHLGMLLNNPISLTISGIPVRLPHPVDYALHKFIISFDRKNEDKRTKDQQMASLILDTIREREDDVLYLKKACAQLTKKQQKRISHILEEHGYGKII